MIYFFEKRNNIVGGTLYDFQNSEVKITRGQTFKNKAK